MFGAVYARVDFANSERMIWGGDLFWGFFSPFSIHVDDKQKRQILAEGFIHRANYGDFWRFVVFFGNELKHCSYSVEEERFRIDSC